MQLQERYIWLGAVTLLAASFITPIYLQRADDPPQQAPREPELFGFLRPMESPQQAIPRHYSANGALMVDTELERLFADFISAYGDQPPAAMTADMEQQIVQHFKPDAVSEAKRLFERYLAYRHALHGAERGRPVSGSPVAAARERIETKRRIRAQYFNTQESEALFALEDASEMDAAERLEINQNAALTEAQRQERLEALNYAAPPVLRAAQEAPLKAARLEEATQKLRADGASEEDVFRLRAEAFSPEVAQRLMEAEQKEKVWQNRVASYIAERNRVIEDPALPYANRAAALQQLLDAHFNADEQTLVSVHE